MWLKVVLLATYLLCLFLLSRLFEAASWYHDTGTLISSFAALNPIELSVKKLKQLLDDRGVSYSGVVEKQELVALVESSGSPTSEEVMDVETPSKTSGESTKFTCGSHFYEEVEDTKDSAWLVQVVMDDMDPPLLPEKIWKEVRLKVKDFGVRTGVFKCSLDRRLCDRKGWTTARLILALPRGNKAKEDVIMHNYLLPSSSLSVLQWVRKHLASRVKEITSDSELEQWMTYTPSSKKTELRVILFSILKSCPMFLSALAIKFNGRVKFATVDTSTVKSYKKFINSLEQPVYLVVTPEKNFVYGKNRGECYNFKSMEFFLRTFVPEMNDIFLWSLVLVNAIAGFELFFMYSHIWKHFLLYVICVVKYNCVLFLLWLMVLGLYQFPFMQTCTDAFLQCVRCVSGSNIASVLRADYKSFYSSTFLLGTFVVFASISGFFLRKFKWLQVDDDTSIFAHWWSVPGETVISPYFFRSRVPLTRSIAPLDHDLEIGMELLIERLAVPNLWLQPVINMDYLKDLPVWRYRGWCEADDDDGKVEVLYSSDDENTNLITFKPVHESTVHDVESTVYTMSPQSNISPSNENSMASQEQCDKTHDQSIVDSAPCSNITSSSSSCAACGSDISSKPNSEKPEEQRAPQGMLEFRECSICLESYRYSELLCGLPCGHNFHMHCIMSWISRDNHCCPICRWPSYKCKNASLHLHTQ
ncbi:E3 ubiquitin-protein ligase RNF103-like [Argiope bruennichi]|uniref:E3 ubiquitin-protein ligase RNF103-like n=1 Tax=Argiope bruennichi TaxID=94029 RepID=UPI0024959DDB|nr:E3 ubiquitin-protein ligase RNF103-like [Argiope bruennichi]